MVCSLALPGAEGANFKAYPRPHRASADHCPKMWQSRGVRAPALSACRDWRGAPRPAGPGGIWPRPLLSHRPAHRSWPSLYRLPSRGNAGASLHGFSRYGRVRAPCEEAIFLASGRLSSCSLAAEFGCSPALAAPKRPNFKAYPRPRRASADHPPELWQPHGGRGPALSVCRDWRAAPRPAGRGGIWPRPWLSHRPAHRSWPSLYRWPSRGNAGASLHGFSHYGRVRAPCEEAIFLASGRLSSCSLAAVAQW